MTLYFLLKAKEDYKAYLENYKSEDNNQNLKDITFQKAKFEQYMDLLDKWMYLRENKYSVEKYLIGEGYNKVLIYGYGILGRHLVSELVNTSVSIIGIVDLQKGKIDCDFPCFLPDEPLPLHDVVVVTPVAYKFDIFNENRQRYKKMIALDDIINTMICKLS